MVFGAYLMMIKIRQNLEQKATQNPIKSYEVDKNNYSPEELRAILLEYNQWLGQTSAKMGLEHFIGTINARFHEKIVDYLQKDGLSIAVSSGGGVSETSILTGLDIFPKKVTIHIFGICASGCAEDIIVSAKDLKFFDEPIIAYHGNNLSVQHFLKGPGLIDPCPNPASNSEFLQEIKPVIEQKRKLYELTGKNIDFWEEQIERLGQPELTYTLTPPSTCSRLQVFSNAEYWLPTSWQLENLLGLEFEGSLCTDSLECIKSKLPVYFGRNRRLIVGDNLVITP